MKYENYIREKYAGSGDVRCVETKISTDKYRFFRPEREQSAQSGENYEPKRCWEPLVCKRSIKYVRSQW